MTRHARHQVTTPDDVLDRLWELERSMGLGTAAEFARQIGVTPTSVSPQKLWNWRNGRDRISLETLLLLKPSVRALLLLERPDDAEIFAEGKHAGLVAAKQAIEKEMAHFLALGAEIQDLDGKARRSKRSPKKRAAPA